MKRIVPTLLFLAFCLAGQAFGQCLETISIDQMVAAAGSSGQTLDRKLHKRILALKKEVLGAYRSRVDSRRRANLLTRGVFDLETRIETREKIMDKKDDKALKKLCLLLQEKGWVTREMAGADGVSAFFYIIKNFTPYEFQMRVLPAVQKAVDSGNIEKNEDYASFLDRLRLRAGVPQIFGTQAFVRQDLLVVAPLLSAEKVDEWRAIYKMPPLEEYMKFLERNYQMLSIRDTGGGAPVLRSADRRTGKNESETHLLPADIDEEAILIETQTVMLQAAVIDPATKTRISGLPAKGFRVFENNKEQEITYFNHINVPSDLVLLLDLSGSTVEKQALIRKAVRRFINASQAGDRISIVTFTDEVKLVSPLTADKAGLLDKVDNIAGGGITNLWDAIEHTLKNSFNDSSKDRRRAIILLTDGMDNSLSFGSRRTNAAGRPIGSDISFGGLVEQVRINDVTIIPIHLFSEERSPCTINVGVICNIMARTAANAQTTLNIIAEESGGGLYTAEKLEDLEGVYERILDDLGSYYTIGYEPSDVTKNGRWRSIKIEIVDRSGLVVRTRTGYYAR